MKKLVHALILALVFTLTIPGVAQAKWIEQKQAVAIPEDTTMIGDTIYFAIEGMDFAKYRSILVGYQQFAWKKAVIDLNTHGGSLFDALGVASIFQEQIDRGKTIEIRGRGLIASAGLIILLSGSPGHRLIDPNSLIMFHELSAAKFLAIETPSDKEEEAAIFRKIQNKVNSFISSRSKITEEELTAKIKKKEFWLDAEEALRYGFADGLLR